MADVEVDELKIKVSEEGTQSTESKLSSLSKTIDSLANSVTKMANSFGLFENQGNTIANTFNGVSQKGSKVVKDIDNIKGAVDKYVETTNKTSNNTVFDIDNLEKSGNAIEENIRKTNELADSTKDVGNETQKLKDISFLNSPIAVLEKKIELTKAKIGELKTELQNLSESDTKTKELDITNKITKAQDELKKLEAEYQKQQNGGFDTKGLQQFLSLLGGTGSKVSGLVGKFSSLKGIVAGLSGSMLAISGIVAGIAVTVGVIAFAWKQTKQVAQGLLNIVKKIGKAIVDEIKRKIQDLIQPIQTLGKQIRRVILNRTIREAFNMVQQGFSEGIKNVAQGMASANKVMSQYSTQIMYLKNSIGSAMIPLLKQLYPLFESLTNVVIEATNALNQMLSILGGSSTYTKAKRQYVDYAESVTSSSNKAKKSVSRLTASFDELNDLTESTSADDTDMTNYFTTATVEANVSDFFKRLKAQFSSGDMSGIGQELANKLNKEIDKLDVLITGKWKQKANTWAKSLGTFLNSSIATLDFTKLGKTIGDGVNLIASTINNFMSTMNFQNLGSQISNLLYGMVMTIEWDGIGNLFLEEILKVFDTLKGFTEKMLEKPEGETKTRIVLMVEHIFKGLTDALNQNMDKIADIGTTIGDFIILVFEFGATVFGQSKFWDKLGDALSELCKKLADKFEDPKFVESVKKFIEGLADVACTLIEAFNESGLIESISNLMKEVFGDEDVKSALKDVTESLGTLAGEWFGLKFRTGWLKFYYEAMSALTAVKSFFSGSSTETTSGKLVKGVAKSVMLSMGGSVQMATIVADWIGRISKIFGFASGGFPEDGLFYANHNELVGGFSNGKTAVANNNQIISGIQQGVKNAIAESGGFGGGTTTVKGDVYLDTKKVGSLVADDVGGELYRKGWKVRGE